MAKLVNRVSSGHKMGQVIGDWWEQHVVLPLLAAVANQLELFLDSRFVERECRTGSKVLWSDQEGNKVDYDFVLEIGGSTSERGVPVAFIESFWRRGSRHSKDKARDDTNKLLPMRSTYPTARFLSIAACGEFTEPAREYVRTRNVDLFFIPKARIVEAFADHGMTIDYADTLPEENKAELADRIEKRFVGNIPGQISETLTKICGPTIMTGYSNRILAALSALPLTIEITESNISDARRFDNTDQVDVFLENPDFQYANLDLSYKYRAEYSDGSTFETQFILLKELKRVNKMMSSYVKHIRRVAS